MSPASPLPRKPPAQRARPTVSLVLGGGGARGFAHIVVLETLDELGVRPVSIVGASMGAVVGAAYAAGHSGAALRRHALALFRDRADVMARMFAARVGRIADLWSGGGGLGNPLLVDGEIVLDKLLPRPLPARFEDLAMPFTALCTDYYGRGRLPLSSGALRPAVAGSMALPWLVRPVRHDGRVLVDGGAVDPLPIGDADAGADIILAVDVSGGLARPDETRLPGPVEGMLGLSAIMQSALTESRLAAAPANVRVLRPPVQDFKLLDFFGAKAILAASEPVRDQIRQIVRA